MYVCMFHAALVFGKSAATNVNSVRMHSISTGWSDSDSSVDSMPGSSADEDDDQEEDWPKKTGFQVCMFVHMYVCMCETCMYVCAHRVYCVCVWGGGGGGGVVEELPA